MKKLSEVAKVLRSKNSGPFQITLDILFDSEEIYTAIKSANIFTKPFIANLYNLDESDIQELVYFDAALGIKITYNRKISSGTVGDRDVYGAQQHAPLLNILVPIK